MYSKTFKLKQVCRGPVLIALLLVVSFVCPLRAAEAPAEVWVDDDYRPLPVGTLVNWPYTGPGSFVIGSNAFATVQGALDAMNLYATVRVAPGEYRENIAVEKPCAIIGPNAGKGGADPTRGAEAVLRPGFDDPFNGQIVYLRISGVSIDGFLFEGHNPDLGGGESIGGLTANTSAAIQNSWFWDQETWAEIDHITIANNVIRNIFFDGVFYETELGSTHSWNYITNNLFQNVWEGIQTYAPHTVIADNTFTNVTRGLSLHGATGAASAGFSPAVLRNKVIIRNPADWLDFRAVGIWVNYRQGDAPALEVAENTVTFSQSLPEDKVGYGLWALTVDNGRSVTFRDNLVTAKGPRTIGMLASSIDPGATVAVTGGQINNAGFGVFAGRNDVEWGDGPARLTLNNVLIASSAAATGVCARVGTTAPADWSQIEIAGGTTDNGGAVTIACLGEKAHILFPGATAASLNSPSSRYISLGSNGATPAATDVDAQKVLFNGLIGSSMTPAQLAATEEMIYDKKDNRALGFVAITDRVRLWISPRTGGKLVEACGISGQTWTIEVSTDFISWVPLHHAALPFNYLDADSDSCSCRFYRAVRR